MYNYIYICNIYKSYESSQEVPLHLLQPRGSSEQLAAMQPGCNVDTFAPTHPGVPKVNPPSPPVPGGEGHLCDEANTSWNKPWAQRGGGMDFLPLGYIGLLKGKKKRHKVVAECCRMLIGPRGSGLLKKTPILKKHFNYTC